MKVAFAFLAVAFFALAVPHSAQAQAVCTASNYGLFGNDGDQDLLNCNTGTSATASATLSYNGAPACGKLTLWDLDANVLVDRQTGCGGSLFVSGYSISGYNTHWLS